MTFRLYCFAVLLLFWSIVGVLTATEKASIIKQITWELNSLSDVGGHPTQVLGTPRVIQKLEERGVQFDGQRDGLIVDVNPLAETEQFSLEVVFRPDAGGSKEQRFVHIQEKGSENRILIETRLTEDKHWFLDTFIRSGETDQTLYAEQFLHPTGEWFHAALVFDGRQMKHYVNGTQEMAANIRYQPLKAGQTSLGVRLNRVFWFKGTIRKVRFTNDALDPSSFLKP